MEVENSYRDGLLSEIKRNYPLALLAILPGIEGRAHKMKGAAIRLGIEESEFEGYVARLLEAGLWTFNGSLYKTNFEFLEMGDLTIEDYLAMTVNIVSRLSGEGTYEYEYMSLATNRDLIKAYVTKVRKALNELYRDSQALEDKKTCLFSWTHTGAIELEITETGTWKTKGRTHEN